MDQELALLQTTALFSGVDAENIHAMLNCLSATTTTYKKGQFIWLTGSNIAKVALVLQGNIQVIKEDFWGNRTIFAQMGPGDLFGETYACIPQKQIGVSVLATTAAKVLFLDIHKILTTCTSSCQFHNQVIHNFVRVLAQKNLFLTKKMSHLAKRSTKEKLLSYLSDESLKNGSSTFTIPFNRQQLADYLTVERSALSSELGRLRDEGVLSFNKNSFTLFKLLEE